MQLRPKYSASLPVSVREISEIADRKEGSRRNAADCDIEKRSLCVPGDLVGRRQGIVFLALAQMFPNAQTRYLFEMRIICDNNRIRLNGM